MPKGARRTLLEDWSRFVAKSADAGLEQKPVSDLGLLGLKMMSQITPFLAGDDGGWVGG